jgi:nucleoside diphosphate kinase
MKESHGGCRRPAELRIAGSKSVDMPSSLSASSFKRALYGTDTYAIEGWGQFVATLSDPLAFAKRHTYLLVKPEAVVSGQLDVISEWWTRNGFRAVAARSLQFNRWMVRALWGYHWNAVTEDHRCAVDGIMTSGRSGLIILRDITAAEVSASERLACQKGPADPARRSDGELRQLLGAEGGPLLNFVHSPDEPLDFVREMAVLLDGDTLTSLITTAVCVRDESAHDLARQLWRDLYQSVGKAGQIAELPRAITARVSRHSSVRWVELVDSVREVSSQAEGVQRLLDGRGEDKSAVK